VPGTRSTRLQLLDQVDQLARAAAQPRTVAELSARTGLHERTIYRLLASLPAEGFRITVGEEPRAAGSGRATRRYTITRLAVAAAGSGRRGRTAATRARRDLEALERALGELAPVGRGARPRQLVARLRAAVEELAALVGVVPPDRARPALRRPRTRGPR